MDAYSFHQNLCNHWRFEIFDTLSTHVDSKGKKVKFIQVGANVGSSEGDPIFGYILHHGWQGALVEPVPYLFEKLKDNYAQYPGLSFFQLCCSSREGNFPFYMVSEESLSDSALGTFLSSFEKDVILRHKAYSPNIESFITEIEVETVRVDAVVQRAGLQGFNALVIDTEGHDDKVIQGLNLDIHAPELIMMEHYHLKVADMRDNHERLLDYGYVPVWMYSDIIYLRKADFNYPLIKKIIATSEIMYRI